MPHFPRSVNSSPQSQKFSQNCDIYHILHIFGQQSATGLYANDVIPVNTRHTCAASANATESRIHHASTSCGTEVSTDNQMSGID